jgi:nucleotide-binding universal stress UspA family protein
MFKRILIATDFSDHAASAYSWAQELASSNQGTLVLVHALEDDLVATAPVFAGYMQADVLDVGRYREEFRLAAKRALEEVATKMRKCGVEVETHLLEGGKPSVVIVEGAKDLGCSTIVLATHGRGGLVKFLLGSTAEKIVRMAQCPVLTVHDADPAADEIPKETS